MQASVQRRAVRRAVRTECQAVGLAEFRLFGDEVLDLSPVGMLVRCDSAAHVGDDVVVSFKVPGEGAPWLDAEATVARLIRGFRANDHGLCAGLTFTYFEKSARNELLARLAGYPPPIPRRRLKTARERVSIRDPRSSYGLSGRDAHAPAVSVAEQPSVLVQRVVTLWNEPVFPLVRRRRVPRGTFCD